MHGWVVLGHRVELPLSHPVGHDRCDLEIRWNSFFDATRKVLKGKVLMGSPNEKSPKHKTGLRVGPDGPPQA